MRQLADGHWVLAFSAADKAALAVTLAQQHSARLQALYGDALAPLCAGIHHQQPEQEQHQEPEQPQDAPGQAEQQQQQSARLAQPPAQQEEQQQQPPDQSDQQQVQQPRDQQQQPEQGVAAGVESFVDTPLG
jgi:hypothetical protein